MKKIILTSVYFALFSTPIMAAENLEPESVKVSKKIITINQEAMRAPASVQNTETQNEEETLTEAMEKVEEPKLWFNP